MLGLRVPTPAEWLSVVLDDLDAFLVDHAACERKASATGMMFVVRFALCGISGTHAILLGLLLSVGGACGGLVMAMIKRDVQIEDAGSLIPGQGGLLNRLNGVFFTAPIFFHFVHYVRPDLYG